MKRDIENRPEISEARLARPGPSGLLLLVVPALLLLAFGFVLRPRPAALFLERTEILSGNIVPGHGDLSVRAIVRYQAPSLWQSWFGEPILDFDLTRLSLVTESGRKIVPATKSYSSFDPLGGQTYSGDVTCSFAEVPSSAKEVTLQALVTLSNREALPLEIKVFSRAVPAEPMT